MPVSEHDVGAHAGTVRCARHGVTVDEHRLTECAVRPLHERGEIGMIGVMMFEKQGFGFPRAETATADFPRPGDNPRNDPEARCDPPVAGGGTRALDHLGIQIARTPVEIDNRARNMRDLERRPVRRCGGKQLVDESVLGTPELPQPETALPEKLRRIGPTAVRGTEHRSTPEASRFDYSV